jgi:hypothetical protein
MTILITQRIDIFAALREQAAFIAKNNLLSLKQRREKVYSSTFRPQVKYVVSTYATTARRRKWRAKACGFSAQTVANEDFQ